MLSGGKEEETGDLRDGIITPRSSQSLTDYLQRLVSGRIGGPARNPWLNRAALPLSKEHSFPPGPWASIGAFLFDFRRVVARRLSGGGRCPPNNQGVIDESVSQLPLVSHLRVATLTS